MKNQDKFDKFFTHCPKYQQLRDYAEAKLLEKEEEKIARQLNQCNQENCKCEEMIEGIQLTAYAEKLVKERPELLMNYDEERMYKNLLPEIEKAFQVKTTPTFTVHKNGQFSQKKTLNQSFRFLGVAAAVVLLVVLAWRFWVNTQEPENRKISNNNQNEEHIQPDSTAQNNDKQDKERLLEQPDDEKNNRDIEEQKPNSREQNNQQPINQEELLAFEPNVALESLVNNNMRGTNNEIEITQVTPDNLTNVTQKIRFQWTVSREVALIVEILDNKNQFVQEIIIPAGQNFAELDVKDWKKGLYYWKLYDENELYHTGKFTVKK